MIADPTKTKKALKIVEELQFASIMGSMKFVLLIWFIHLLMPSESKHKEVYSRRFNYGFDRNFINMTVDASNKTHLGALKIWNARKLPTLSVNLVYVVVLAVKVFSYLVEGQH